MLHHCGVEFRLPLSFYYMVLMKQGKICFSHFIRYFVALPLFYLKIVKYSNDLKYVWFSIFFTWNHLYIHVKKVSTIIHIHIYIECSKIILVDSKDYWILSTLSGYTHICNYLEVMKSCVYCRHTELRKYIHIHIYADMRLPKNSHWEKQILSVEIKF